MHPKWTTVLIGASSALMWTPLCRSHVRTESSAPPRPPTSATSRGIPSNVPTPAPRVWASGPRSPTELSPATASAEAASSAGLFFPLASGGIWVLVPEVTFQMVFPPSFLNSPRPHFRPRLSWGPRVPAAAPCRVTRSLCAQVSSSQEAFPGRPLRAEWRLLSLFSDFLVPLNTSYYAVYCEIYFTYFTFSINWLDFILRKGGILSLFKNSF